MVQAVIKLFGEEVGGWMVGHVGLSVLIFLFAVSILLRIFNYFFKITKKEIDPLGWLVHKLGNALTKGVRTDIADMRTDNIKQFDQIKKDRADSIKKMQDDYNKQITDLKSDIDSFEKTTNISLSEMKKSTDENCKTLKRRMDIMEKSNDLQSIRQIRAHVLDFANSCMNGREHSQNDFDNIFDENEKYEALCKKHKIKNNKYKADYEFIEKIYQKCREENSFLGGSDVSA